MFQPLQREYISIQFCRENYVCDRLRKMRQISDLLISKGLEHHQTKHMAMGKVIINSTG
jgi:hypothetical protein